MKNIKSELKGSILTLTIDISKNSGLTKSKKSRTVASTGGNVPIEGCDNSRIRLGLNCFEMLPKDERP